MTPSQGFWFLKNPVEFVRSSERSSTQNEVCVSNIKHSSILTGNEAKSIYESIIHLPSSKINNPNNSSAQSSEGVTNKRTSVVCITSADDTNTDTKPPKKLKKLLKCSIPDTWCSVTSFFKAAESGDLATVEKILSSGLIDINAIDQYSWTALMMASYNGHMPVVKLLLLEGASWKDYVDGSAYDAYDLACLGGHHEIAYLLRHQKKLAKSVAMKRTLEMAHRSVKRETLLCKTCQCLYSATTDGKESENSHHSSTLHQFCKHEKERVSAIPHFYLSANNKGYKMLRKEGWDGASGLGSQCKGQKFPVKTILKRDRSGLGCLTQSPARITHFGANDTSAIKSLELVSFSDRKQQLQRKEARERELERKFRCSFH
ncbi:unnamed protein product [Clavelina lepadiformis]|uniref:G-patch domain-containing protein n=1 Tax=Clavelina lepadiformis TaxID=159417 RepID=A0ABP0GK37_CLALP